MPYIMGGEDMLRWLSGEAQSKKMLFNEVRPLSGDAMGYYRVGLEVNDPSNNSAKCLERI